MWFMDASIKSLLQAIHNIDDVIISEKDFNVIDFRGFLDQSDFHFKGFLRNYDLWLANEKNGETYLEFDLDSKRIKLENLFAYGGENYVPEDYRHEEIENLKLADANNINTWLRHLAMCQYSVEEMQDGVAWSRLLGPINTLIEKVSKGGKKK
jgi:hypothetical protein